MRIFALALKRCVRDKGTMILLIVLPVAVVAMPPASDAPAGAWAVLPMGYHFLGIIVLFAAAKMVHFLLQDRASGVLLRIAAAPVSSFSYLGWNVLAYSMVLVVQIAITVTAGALVGHNLTNPGLLFATYALFALTAVAFALAWCSLFRNREASMLIMVNVVILMSMLGGLMWPIEVMPEALQRPAMLLPTYWLAEAKQVVVTGGRLQELGLPYLLFLLLTVLFLLIGSRRRIG